MPNVMAAQPNIVGAVCESNVIPFLVPLRKVWLTPLLECWSAVHVQNAANIGEHKTWTLSEFCTWRNSVVYIHSVAAQETAKHRAKFGRPPLKDVAPLTKPRSETR